MALFRHSKTMQINPWLIHVNVWQKPLQYCNVISLQRIKINEKKKKKAKGRDAWGRVPESSAHRASGYLFQYIHGQC